MLEIDRKREITGLERVASYHRDKGGECLGRVGGWGMGWVGCGRLGVVRWRVFHGGEKVGAGKGGSVSLVEKMRINNEHTLYACPVHPPAPPHRHSQGSRPLVPSWLPTVAACCVVRVVDERNCQKWKLTCQGGHMTSLSEPNKMQNSVGDPSGCTT